jgi:hypothetical protein
VVLVYFLGSWVLLYIRVSSKPPGTVGSLYSWFGLISWDRGFFILVVSKLVQNNTFYVICKFGISLDILFRGFNEARNPRKFALHELLSFHTNYSNSNRQSIVLPKSYNNAVKTTSVFVNTTLHCHQLL